MTKLLSIRLVAILVGLGFAFIALYSFVLGAYAAMTEEPAGHLPYEEPREKEKKKLIKSETYKRRKLKKKDI